MTRAFLHNVAAKGLAYASNLVTYHNVAYMQVQIGGSMLCLHACVCARMCVFSKAGLFTSHEEHTVSCHTRPAHPARSAVPPAVPAAQRLTRQIREAIKAGAYPQFVREFVYRHYPKVRLWVGGRVWLWGVEGWGWVGRVLLRAGSSCQCLLRGVAGSTHATHNPQHMQGRN